MQTIVWVMKPHREARCKLCGNAALLPMDKPVRAGGYICRRCRLAVVFGRIMEVVTTMVQTLIALAIVGLLGGLELDLIGVPEGLAAVVTAIIGIGAAQWLKDVARGLRHGS